MLVKLFKGLNNTKKCSGVVPEKLFESDVSKKLDWCNALQQRQMRQLITQRLTNDPCQMRIVTLVNLKEREIIKMKSYSNNIFQSKWISSTNILSFRDGLWTWTSFIHDWNDHHISIGAAMATSDEMPKNKQLVLYYFCKSHTSTQDFYSLTYITEFSTNRTS